MLQIWLLVEGMEDKNLISPWPCTYWSEANRAGAEAERKRLERQYPVFRGQLVVR